MLEVHDLQKETIKKDINTIDYICFKMSTNTFGICHMESEGYIHYRYSVYAVYLSINQRWQFDALVVDLQTT